jgi:pimeloyl-ACP methyl ester carboxylesterase
VGISIMQPFRIESLLSARQFVQPQLVGDRLYFISNLSGRLSLYVMNVGGSVPEPLVPPDLALPNPHHLDHSVAYRVLPKLGKILLMLDHNGDENYQPMFVPLEGGAPAPIFGDRFAGQQVMCAACDPQRNLALLAVDPRNDPVQAAYLANLETGELTELARSLYGTMPVAHTPDFTAVVLIDQYTFGDEAYYLWRKGEGERKLLLGVPVDQRKEGQVVPPNGLAAAHLTDKGLLFISALYADGYGLTYLPLNNPQAVAEVSVHGLVHTGQGELTDVQHRRGDICTITYNIDGASWVYEGMFDEELRRFDVRRVLVGQGQLAGGVVESIHRAAALDGTPPGDRYAFSFSTATSPSQLYIVDETNNVLRQTNERILGIAPHLLAEGEDASYVTHDGLRISARLYLPAPELGYTGKRPVIFYIHGGPQSQERPDFTWFSMPLIQFFTLNGFAVWVPNVRGSSGYGISYMKRVDNDWGGLDRLDHVAALNLLREDPRVDVTRAGVMGRSYGGYMTLTLAGRHPDLWKAAVDMFGPYNLFTFIDRLPEAWKTYFYQVVGHPERDHDELVARSPSTYLHNLACPLLVIQGANDPRVVERESRDVVETLQAQGKTVEYVMYPDEGHDVLTFANKVHCYTRITEFFKAHLLA